MISTGDLPHPLDFRFPQSLSFLVQSENLCSRRGREEFPGNGYRGILRVLSEIHEGDGQTWTEGHAPAAASAFPLRAETRGFSNVLGIYPNKSQRAEG